MNGWTETDHARLATLFNGYHASRARCHDLGDGATYPGYTPETVEAPNGDTRECQTCGGTGRDDPHALSAGYGTGPCDTCSGFGRVPNVDAAGTCPHCYDGQACLPGGCGVPDCQRCGKECPWCEGTHEVRGKRYLHVAEKYLRQCPGLEWPREYLARAHYEACRVAEALNVPAAYWPRPEHGALRVLDYPPGAGTVEHTDFDLFTVLLWRSTPADLERTGKKIAGLGSAAERLDAFSPGLHIGELGELVGLGPATPHRVPARPYVQKSIVYFALPDHGAVLPCLHRGVDCRGGCGAVQTVGTWLAERMARSRVYT